MEESLTYITYVTICLMLIIMITKFIVLFNGKKIRADLITFFWFSNYDIINSSSKRSERKKILMNKLTMAIFGVAFLGISAMAYIIKDDL